MRGLPNNDEWIYQTKDNNEIIVKLTITALRDENHIINGFLGIAEDITLIKQEEQQLEKYHQLIDQNIITSSANLRGEIIEVSQAFCNISGYSREELMGQDHSIVRHPDMPKSFFEDLWKHLSNNQPWSGEIKNRKKDGSYYWVKAYIEPTYDNSGKKTGYTAIRQDITDKKLIEHISITDGLTKIYNRRHFDELFPKMLEINHRNKKYISFLIMDVDHFKQYNDTYGHQKGDKVLIEIAKKLNELMHRQDDYCFRLGGEEFGNVYYSDNPEQAYQFAEKIKNEIENLKIAHAKNSASDYITSSMGLICVQPGELQNEEVIYREADKLLYEAKMQGRNKVIMKEM